MVVLHTAVTKQTVLPETVMEDLVGHLEVITEHLAEIKEALQMVQVELLRMVGLVKVVTGEDQRQQVALDLYLSDQSKYKI
jgi:hypothetical protein